MKRVNGWARIELSEKIAPVAIGISVLVGITPGVDATSAWVLTGDSLAEQLMFPLWIAAGLLGFFHFGWEDLTSTRNYTRHRGVPLEHLFCLRAVSGLAVVALLVVVPPLVHGLAFRWFAPNGDLISWRRLGPTLAFGLLAPTTFAAAGWGVNTNGPWPNRIGHAIVAACSVVIVARRLAEPGPGEWAASLPLYAAVMGALTVAFLVAARGSFLRANDLDRPLPVGHAFTDGACLMFAYTIAFGSLIVAQQEKFLMGALGYGPSIVEFGGGDEAEIGLATTVDGLLGEGRGLARRDAVGGWLTPHGPPPARPEPVEAARRLFHPWMHFVSLRRPAWSAEDRGRFDPSDVQFDAPLEELWSDSGAGTCGMLDRDDGCVFVVRLPLESGLRAPARWRVERPDGGPLDRGVTVVGREDDQPAGVLIGDPRDGTLWRVETADASPRLVAVELPGGAAFRAWSGHDPVLVGTDGPTFSWDGRTFERSETPFGSNDTYERARRAAGHVLETIEHGPDGLTARIVDAESRALVFEHTFRPADVPGRSFGVTVGTRVFSWLRPPAIVLASFVGAPPAAAYQRLSYGRAFLREPLVAGGRHSGWVAFVFASWGALAWLSVRHLRRGGASLGRLLFWLAAILLGGVAGMMAFGSIEFPRLWKNRPAVGPAAAPRLVSRPAGA